MNVWVLLLPELRVCDVFLQLYLTGAVYSLDGSDSLKETMQTSVAAAEKVTAQSRGAGEVC